MREIRVRARFRDGSGWYFWEPKSIFADDRLVSSDEIDMATLGQSTGLYDKNESEIFEGDIGVRKIGMHDPVKGIVVWNQGGLWFCHDIEGTNLIGIPSDQWEIIGNIYENSDLLV